MGVSQRSPPRAHSALHRAQRTWLTAPQNTVGMPPRWAWTSARMHAATCQAHRELLRQLRCPSYRCTIAAPARACAGAWAVAPRALYPRDTRGYMSPSVVLPASEQWRIVRPVRAYSLPQAARHQRHRARDATAPVAAHTLFTFDCVLRRAGMCTACIGWMVVEESPRRPPFRRAPRYSSRLRRAHNQPRGYCPRSPHQRPLCPTRA